MWRVLVIALTWPWRFPMSADYWHMVTVWSRSTSLNPRGGVERTYKAGFHRVEAGALVLTNAEETGLGYRGPDGRADYIILPLDTIGRADVHLVERTDDDR